MKNSEEMANASHTMDAIGGIAGVIFGPGFHPWCWYGLLIRIAISVGIPCIVCLLD